ncbi:hypothetical protein SLE2022_303190 [Rubroshorea leprosula]
MMTDSEARYQGNGGDVGNNYAVGDSPQPRDTGHGGADDHSDSKSQNGSRKYERVSSRSREREKERDKDRRTGTITGRKAGIGIGIGSGKRIVTAIIENGIGIGVGNAVREEIGEEIEMTMTMIITEAEIMIDRDYDRDRRDRHSRRSRSHSTAKSEHRSRSRSLSPSPSPSLSGSRSKRISGFDWAPPPEMLAASAAAAAAAVPAVAAVWKVRIKILVQWCEPTSVAFMFKEESMRQFDGQILGTNQAIPGVMPNLFNLGTGQQFGAIPVMPVPAMTQQATRHARRVYVGGLPPTANEQSVAIFFNQVMAMIGGNTAGPGDAVVNVYINHEKKFAFVEMRSVAEASNAMALDGIIFEGAPVKVRRPTDYNPSLAATLGPSQPGPTLNLAAVGLTPGSALGLESPDRIFVGGLPCYFTEVQIRELLESFGPLRGFDLVKDRETGNSKGYAFCVYQDPSVTDIACAALNGIKWAQQIAMQRLLQPQRAATKLVCLTQALSEDDLKDYEEYEDIVEDMRQEVGRHSILVNVIIPRPNPNGEPSPGVGKVFLEYSDVDGAKKSPRSNEWKEVWRESSCGSLLSREKVCSGGV